MGWDGRELDGGMGQESVHIHTFKCRVGDKAVKHRKS